MPILVVEWVSNREESSEACCVGFRETSNVRVPSTERKLGAIDSRAPEVAGDGQGDACVRCRVNREVGSGVLTVGLEFPVLDGERRQGRGADVASAAYREGQAFVGVGEEKAVREGPV